MSIYRVQLHNTSNMLTLRMTAEQIHLQIPPELFRVNSCIPQICTLRAILCVYTLVLAGPGCKSWTVLTWWRHWPWLSGSRQSLLMPMTRSVNWSSRWMHRCPIQCCVNWVLMSRYWVSSFEKCKPTASKPAYSAVLYYVCQGRYVMPGICLFVCLSVSLLAT